MMRVLKWVVAAPFILIFLLFAVANDHIVSVRLDPFAGDIPGLALSAPRWLVLILSIMFGILIGGVATWLGQGKYRRAAKQFRAEADRIRAQLPASH